MVPISISLKMFNMSDIDRWFEKTWELHDASPINKPLLLKQEKLTMLKEEMLFGDVLGYRNLSFGESPKKEDKTLSGSIQKVCSYERGASVSIKSERKRMEVREFFCIYVYVKNLFVRQKLN